MAGRLHRRRAGARRTRSTGSYDAFAACGFRRQAFYPCYGLAEATLIVTGGRADALPVVRHVDAGDLLAGRATRPHGGQTRWLTGCGRPGEDQGLRIVDPDERREVPPGTVGEIWVRGPSVATGYWGTPGSFGTPAGGRARYLRTGDLGFVDDDGELFVTGRIKDMIVVRGRNHSPDDIERTALSSDARLRAGRCAAFGPSDGDGDLAVVAEVRGGTSAEEAGELAAGIRSAVTAEHGLAAGVVTLLPPGELPVTSSGKVRRRECRRLLEEGTLRTLLVSRLRGGSDPEPGPEPEPEAERAASGLDTTQTRMAEAIRVAAATVLDATSVEVGRPLTDYGLDSVKAVELVAVLRRDAALVVPLDAILRGADCRELAAEAVPDRPGAAGAAGTAGTAGTADGQPAPARGRLTEGEQAIWHLQRLDPAGPRLPALPRRGGKRTGHSGRHRRGVGRPGAAASGAADHVSHRGHDRRPAPARRRHPRPRRRIRGGATGDRRWRGLAAGAGGA